MIFMKSREGTIRGMVEGVNASMSLCKPGTAAEMSSEGPRTERRVDNKRG